MVIENYKMCLESIRNGIKIEKRPAFIDWQNYSCEDTGTTNAMGRACAISIRVSMAFLFGSRKTHLGGGGAVQCLQEKVLATESDTLSLSPVDSQQSLICRLPPRVQLGGLRVAKGT